MCKMPDAVGRPDICCMNTSAACIEHGPCSWLATQFHQSAAVAAPNAQNASKLMHNSLKQSGAAHEREIIIRWLHEVKKSRYADMIRNEDHVRWYNQTYRH